ncbi:hypothetical protein NitYY0918_C0591 [Nitratiruptor sp. YY09-18]|nr:hypothetical protein NitYY0918_C0591 [Nitratiruptor sp. YY09-18]
MYLAQNYTKYPLWLTIDVEELEDANFGIQPKKKLHIDYAYLIDRWIGLCSKYDIHSTAFVLGSFAKKYPHLVRKLHEAGHEIASHGMYHELIYKIPFKEWKSQTIQAKKILEDLIGKEVRGYRSPSWTLPFEKKYYSTLRAMGFYYSSSYFPFKTYMYGNTIDKKEPFAIYTEHGKITEIPIPKYILPFSGGFYMRILPFWFIRYAMQKLINKGYKPIIYTHPYELLDNLFFKYIKDVKFDMAYILTFAHSANSLQRFKMLLEIYKDR